MTKQKHTPAPWEMERHTFYGKFLVRDNLCIGAVHNLKDADIMFILTAVNSHYQLIEALENLIDHYNSKDSDMKLLRHFISEGEKAISKATGEL